MRAPELFRTSSFRIAGISAGVFALGVLLLFAFIYWQTASRETGMVDRFVERRVVDFAASRPGELVRTLDLGTARSGRHIAFAGLFDAAGRPIAGNVAAIPQQLPIDGKAHGARVGARTVRAAAIRLPDRRVLFIGRDVAELNQLQGIVLRALLLGAIPALVLALGAGALLSWRELRRVRMVQLALAHILHGDLKERLPARNAADDFDRLAIAVNRMLDEIERLIEEIRGVGDNIAHDLRTPLTRVRARLERARDATRTSAELEAAIDGAVAGLDQTLGIVTALLRIAEIEQGSRRAAFGDIDLALIVRDVAELYGPIADDAGLELAVAAPARRPVRGDRDLLVEAVANVLDNAIKFAPAGSRIDLAVIDGTRGPIVRVRDRGPGIPPAERQQVLKRFYRGDKSRSLPGSGLGLGIVGAVMALHSFGIAIGDAEPGCIFDLICAAAPEAAVA